MLTHITDHETGTVTMQDLHALITPSLLQRMCRARVPWPLSHRICGKELITEFFSNDSRFTDAAQEAWPTLKALSDHYGPYKVPDMTAFLPAPEDPLFPEQAFGMHVLLDQAPRVLFQGVDGRWTSWFDRAARALYTYFYGLPSHLKPWARERWDARGATFEYWICIASEFNATMAHQESIGDQQISGHRIEELRRAVEFFYDRRDPFRDLDGSVPPLDEYALVDMVSYVDLDEFWPFYKAAFFSFRVDDAHAPIINKFGRYPYRNAIEGRDSSPDELEWIEENGHFGEADPDVARRVRRDVEAGIWTPLGEGKGKERAEPSPVGDISSNVGLRIDIRMENDRGSVKQNRFKCSFDSEGDWSGLPEELLTPRELCPGVPRGVFNEQRQMSFARSLVSSRAKFKAT